MTVAAQEVGARGGRQVLSPVLDLARDARWGRFEECFGEDPYLVSRIGLAAILGLQGRGVTIDPQHVAVTLKHFAGQGQPEGGRNIAPVNFSEREFRETHLYPFEQAVKVAHARSVVASCNVWNGVPNHINHKLLTGILRDEWGFTLTPEKLAALDRSMKRTVQPGEFAVLVDKSCVGVLTGSLRVDGITGPLPAAGRIRR